MNKTETERIILQKVEDKILEAFSSDINKKCFSKIYEVCAEALHEQYGEIKLEQKVALMIRMQAFLIGLENIGAGNIKHTIKERIKEIIEFETRMLSGEKK